MQYVNSTSITTKKDINHQIRNSKTLNKKQKYINIYLCIYLFFFNIKNKNSFSILIESKTFN